MIHKMISIHKSHSKEQNSIKIPKTITADIITDIETGKQLRQNII